MSGGEGFQGDREGLWQRNRYWLVAFEGVQPLRSTPMICDFRDIVALIPALRGPEVNACVFTPTQTTVFSMKMKSAKKPTPRQLFGLCRRGDDKRRTERCS